MRNVSGKSVHAWNFLYEESLSLYKEYVPKNSFEGSKVFGFWGVKIFRDLRETGPRPELSPAISLFVNVK